MSYGAAPLVHIMRCDRATMLAMAKRTRDSVTPEELVFREAELGAVYVTAEMSEDDAARSPVFLAGLWSAYDRLTAGDVTGGAMEMATAAECLPGTVNNSDDVATLREGTR